MYPIELKNIHKDFQAADKRSDKLQILKGLDLIIEKSISTAIIGKSGAGKSTLLQIAGLLDKPTSGKVFINGEDTAQFSDLQLSKIRNSEIGFIFQSNMLLSDFSALENVMMPSLINKTNKKEAREQAYRLLEKVNLLDRAEHFPSQLSGGEKQRIVICRALINNPSVILADEPTGSLDEANAYEVENLLLDICKEDEKSLLLVTHNLDFANKCNRILTLSNGMLS